MHRLAHVMLFHRSLILLSFHLFFIFGFLSAVLIGWFSLFYFPDHLFVFCNIHSANIAFSSAFISENEFSNFSWLLLKVSRSF